jgi:hypothetical protein
MTKKKQQQKNNKKQQQQPFIWITDCVISTKMNKL